jgi:hypothetical protein
MNCRSNSGSRLEFVVIVVPSFITTGAEDLPAVELMVQPLTSIALLDGLWSSTFSAPLSVPAGLSSTSLIKISLLAAAAAADVDDGRQ